MITIIQNRKKGELLVYIIVWLIVFLMPVFMSRSTYGYSWQRIGSEWLRILPFVLIFVLNNFLFLPHLFLKEKRGVYFFVTILSILILSAAWILIGRYLNGLLTPPQPQPPPTLSEGHNFPVRIRPWYVNFADNFLVSVLVVGFGTAIKLTTKWQEEEQKNRELEKEKLQTELAFLKNQISPHFFMNTLNNIHALVDVNSEDAKESIVKLSRLMRYLLYDSDKGKTTLVKEVEFIKSYVELMKIRVLSNVHIHLIFPNKIPEVEIPPLLFVSLIENAFKHGISYQEKSFIEIFMKMNKNNLHFRIKNSVHEKKTMNEVGGLGLKNLKKRLELIYEGNFTLETKQTDNIFEINIILPMYGNQVSGNR